MDKILPVCDPHFHLWNIDERPNPNLGEAVEERLPIYQAVDYRAEMETLPAPLKLASAVHVETVVGQMEGGARIDTMEETKWVYSQLAPTQAEHPFGMVAYVHLAKDTSETERLLDQHLAESNGRLRGVRMILNHHHDNPALTWPQVERGDFLTSMQFKEGIALLGERNLSFDLQCNPHQLTEAANVFRDYPQTPVILNHLGLLYEGDDSARQEQQWREGMQALADLPHVDVKLSMLWFARAKFCEDAEAEAKVRDLVREAIDLFGVERCMFASNYPVERLMGISIPALYGKFLDWTADLPDDQRWALFHDTAARAYRLG